MSGQSPQSGFDEAYARRFPLFGRVPTRCVEEVASLLERAANVCELGCGDGRDTLPLLAKGYSVLAIDISAVAIDNLRREASRIGVDKNLRTVVADLTQLSLGNERFDAVIGITI